MNAKGFGFTLKGKNDYKLENNYKEDTETFETHYGYGGQNGDGNILKNANIKAFAKFVLGRTNQKGVDIMMGDGAFTVENRENIQEILSKQLILCQFLAALSIVREQGNFVCKMFDTFTPFTVGLVYLMYRAFDKICIHKPNTSRPANSERYIICKNKRPHFEAIRDYLFKVNEKLNKLGFSQIGLTSSKIDVTEIVPLPLLLADSQFCDYMRQSNDLIGKRQIAYLVKIRAFHQNENLFDTRQRHIRVECLKKWKIPDQVQRNPRIKDPRNQSFPNFDWKFVLLGCLLPKDCTYFLGVRNNKTYYFNKLQCVWTPIPKNFKFHLPDQTLLYTEFLQENEVKDRKLKKSPTLYIIDAIYVSSENWQEKYSLKKRNEMLNIFIKAMHKSSNLDLRVKELHCLENLEDNSASLFLKSVQLQHMISVTTCFNIH